MILMLRFLLVLWLAAALPSWSVQSARNNVRIGDTVTQTLTIVPSIDGPTEIAFNPGEGLVIQSTTPSTGAVINDTWIFTATAGMTQTLVLSMAVTEEAHRDADVLTVYRWGDQTLIAPLAFRLSYRLRFPIVMR